MNHLLYAVGVVAAYIFLFTFFLFLLVAFPVAAIGLAMLVAVNTLDFSKIR